MNLDKKKLLADLIENYKQTHKKSARFFKKAENVLVRGGSHNLRLFAPFPFFDVKCSGSKLTDMDGNTYVDFWQGHFGNVLGHNPKVVLDALTNYFQQGQGLLTGFPGCYQQELAELILSRINSDKIRFTTSGALATMYAIMLAKAYTGRELVMKVGGGWHGAQPFALKGISTYTTHWDQMESAGLSEGIDSATIVTKFNDGADLEEKFDRCSHRIACLIIEPFMTAAGLIFAKKEYLQKAKELTDRWGAVLIFDEVVSGFRFHAGGVQSLYGIEPGLSVFGKSIGGGMPVSAVAGKDEIMELCAPGTAAHRRVKFEGGTYSAHPASMLAGTVFIKHLVEHEQEIYPRIGQLGDKVRREIEAIFSKQGFNVRCTGVDDSVTASSSLVGVHFVNEKASRSVGPEDICDPGVCDQELGDRIFRLSMLEEGFNIFHGFGAISSAHSEAEIQAALDAVERVAQKWTRYKKGNRQ